MSLGCSIIKQGIYYMDQKITNSEQNFIKTQMSQAFAKVSQSTKTFVLEREETRQSIIFEQELNLSSEYINLNPIFNKYCPHKQHRISIYDANINEFINIKKMPFSKNGHLNRTILEPTFILIRYAARLAPAESDSEDGRSGREERSKERSIGEVLQLVKRWRVLHETCTKPHNRRKKINLQEAAKLVGISKKSLDDYYCQLRLAEEYGFDFQTQIQEKIGVLRTFVKNNKPSDKEEAKLHKNQKFLKVLQQLDALTDTNRRIIQQNSQAGGDKKYRNSDQAEGSRVRPLVREVQDESKQQQQMIHLEDQFYREFQFNLEQPLDPLLDLNKKFSFRLSDDQSNSILFF